MKDIIMVILALGCVIGIICFIGGGDAYDKLKGQAIFYNYAEYKCDDKGICVWQWIKPEGVK